MRSKVFTQAWIIKREYNVSFPVALKLSWRRYKIFQRLHSGETEFQFMKKDGTVREAVGTLHPSQIGPVKGTGRKVSLLQIIYWDLAKNAWRSFRLESLIQS